MKNNSNTLGTKLSWIFGIIFSLGSLGSFSEDPLLATFLLLIGLFLIPPITTLIEIETGKNLSGKRKLVITIVALFVFGMLAGPQEETKTQIQSTDSKQEERNLHKKSVPLPKSEPIKPNSAKKEVIESTVSSTSSSIPVQPKKNVIEEKAEPKVVVQPETPLKISEPTGIPVLKIVDGDTIDVLYQGKEERLRIKGINTPETKDPRYPVQCFGKEASAKAKEILEGKNIMLETDGSRGKYGRLLAYLRLLNGKDYGEKMIREGYAWHYRSYSHERMDAYDEAEKYARENNAGLWASSTCNGEKKPVKEVVEETKKSVSKVILPPPAPQQKVEPEPVPVPAQPSVQQEFQESIPSYECSRDAYNCGDFKRHSEAQQIFEYCFSTAGDIHKLDRDNNGVACESLP